MNRLALFLFLPLAACGSVGPNDFTAGSFAANRVSGWFETGQVMKPRADLARTVRELLARQGYTVSNFDEKAERIETEWDVQLSPRFREGTRTKMEVMIVPLDRGGFNVLSRSWFEINNEMQNPSIPEKAVWVGAGVSDKHKDRIPEPAMRFHSMLRLRLFGLNQ